MDQTIDIVIIGAGNVASHLSKSFHEKGHRIVQILGRNKENAKELADQFKCDYITVPHDVNPNADLYMMCVPDTVIPKLAKKLPLLKGILAHTSGGTPLDVISKVNNRCGVFYPFQTFTKGRVIPLTNVPFCIEASSPEVLRELFDLAQSLGAKPLEMDFETRRWLHLAGVFSCNFVNHMLAISKLLSDEKKFPFDVLKPLVFETIKKGMEGNPIASQTGPAVRGDSETIRSHAAMLTTLDEDLRDLYMSLSSSIWNFKQ
jgi:predicted short-subunit dehydrogenase-like oxidoreductase (DUF2520 family)